MSKGLKVKPSKDGECEYEAYHTIFSWLTSTVEIYEKLAEGCGSKFIRIKKKEESKMKKTRHIRQIRFSV